MTEVLKRQYAESSLRAQRLLDSEVTSTMIFQKRRLLPEDSSHQQRRCENGKSCIASVLVNGISLWQSIFSIDNFNRLTPNDPYTGRNSPLTSKRAYYIFIQQIQVLNILNMLYTLHFFSSKYSLFHNANLFGSCIIHILGTAVAQCLRCCATNRKIAGSIPAGVTGIFH